MKITASVTKSSSRSEAMLFTLTYFFFLYINSPLLLENKKITVIAVFLLNKLDHRPLFNYIFSYFHENHCKCYKKLASRSGSMLFTLAYFFLIHTLSSSTGKQKKNHAHVKKVGHISKFLFGIY